MKARARALAAGAGDDVVSPPAGSLRPTIHLTPDRGWMNDPHGVIRRDGLYHVFYQANPASPQWTTGIRWGHASSPDLVSWTVHPPILAPGDGDDGIWTGCAVDGPDGTPVIFYTSAHGPDPQLSRIRTAHPDDHSLMTWHKGPVVAETPTDGAVVVFRDPTVHRENDHWRMFVGAGLADGRPALASFTSEDLRHWRYAGLAAAGRPHEPWTGSAWECPQLITIGDRVILLVSAWQEGETHDVWAGIGSYADGRLAIDHWQRVGYGARHYAPTTFDDDDNQPCALFWIRNVGDDTRTWSGALSVPYRIQLIDDHVVFRPHPTVLDALSRADGPRTATALTFGEDRGPLVAPRDAGGELFRLEAVDETLTVTTDGHVVAAPLPAGGEAIQAIADGAVLEVCMGSGLIGLPLTGHLKTGRAASPRSQR